jgi:hypothetical protein
MLAPALFLVPGAGLMTITALISGERLVYKTKVKASDRLQIKCSKNAIDIFQGSWEA